VVYEVEPGPRVRFGPTEVVGTSSVPESAIRHRLSWDEGDWFDPDEVALTEGRLYQLDLVGSVQTEWPKEGSPIPIRVGVSDRVPRELRLGGGVARDLVNWEVRLRGEYREANFLHPLQSLRLELRPSLVFQEDLQTAAPNVDAQAGLRRDDVVWPRLRGSSQVGFAVTQLEGIQVTGPRFSLGLSRPFVRDRLVVQASAHADYFFSVGFSDLDESLPTDEDRERFGISSEIPLVYGLVRLTYEGRDVPQQPRRGFLVQLEAELGEEIGGDPFSKLVPSLRGYVPLSPSTVAAARVQFGTTLIGIPPVTRRFFSGGASSHRGFGNRRLAPSIVDDNGNITPLGGDHELEISIEIRQDLVELFGQTLGLVAFLDGGDVTLELQDLRPDDLHWAPGLGLRYATPVGPVRFDIGVRATRADDIRPASDFLDRLAYHFTLGEAF
jgi:translocation and assembly module TamA